MPTRFVGLENYLSAIDRYGFLDSVGWTVFITVGSVFVILLCCSMCAWFITRVTNGFTKGMYLLCAVSMVVPFQMVMFTLSLVADRLGLDTPWGIIIIYLGFGAGLAVFMFCGFVKTIPVEIEEAALIDGCSPLRAIFSVVVPIMKPTYISVGILEGHVDLERLPAALFGARHQRVQNHLHRDSVYERVVRRAWTWVLSWLPSSWPSSLWSSSTWHAKSTSSKVLPRER